MKLNSIQFPVFNPYFGPAIELYISGCYRKCPGCCNPELQSFNNGVEICYEDLIDYLKQRENFFNIISFLGGDLLCQNKKEIFSLLESLDVYFSKKVFWLFTGEEFCNIDKSILSYFDYIKTGKYKKELYQNGFPSSSNQKIYKKTPQKWIEL